jgi:iron complex transport system ATP-binding protein
VLRGVTLSFAEGRLAALLGENGSGKSTLLKVLAGILSPSSGRVLLDGRDLVSVPRREAARRVGYLPQGFEPFFPATAREVVLLGRTPWIGPLGSPSRKDHRIADQALEEVDGLALADRDVAGISGGERQRIFLARVLAGEPEVLLLDEPTASLDPRHRFLVLEILLRRAAKGATVVLSTHEVDLAGWGADDAVLVREGRLLAAGPSNKTLTGDLLSTLFSVPACVSPQPDGRNAVVLSPPRPASGRG